MSRKQSVDIAIVGAGLIGLATAYYLQKKYRRKSVVLIDSRDPMSYTSAQSGDNYRNWWPSEVMTQFTNHSISLMREMANESDNVLRLKQRGYLIATRGSLSDDTINGFHNTYNGSQNLVRIHKESYANNYVDPHSADFASTLDGVDVLANRSLIKNTFPTLSPEVTNVYHIRRAGDFSGQQMGTYMLEKMHSSGHQRIRGHVIGIEKNKGYTICIEASEGFISLRAEKIVNAAGPHIGDIADMLDIELPIENIFQQKFAFEDSLETVPRDQPFLIDIDKTYLSWNDEERNLLLRDNDLRWLAEPIEGGIHCRPEGSGKWIKLGWAYNRNPSVADNTRELIEDSHFDPSFPEIVLRGAAKLNTGLAKYISKLPSKRLHYGGYYTMTKENWPLIGPLDDRGAFIAGAMSGFGSMAACAAGSLCADWICHGDKPSYANSLSPARYQDANFILEIQNQEPGIL